ncbi:MAG: ABC transporter permease [Prevotellaceae bacterium]|nr:ABC transporter permease [Prevotellaceae bacterium]
MIEMLSEVLSSMGHNKTRILLTGFSVGWGIFLLIVMLGSGNGIINGIENGFIGTDNNIITVAPGKTMYAAGGRQVGSKVDFYFSDCKELQRRFPDVIRKTMPEMDTTVQVNCGNDHINVPIFGYETDYLGLRSRYVSDGRDISQLDINEGRKVCVVTAPLAKRLFHDADAVGQRIKVYNNSFLIVGVAKSYSGNDEEKSLYAPITTVKNLFFRNDKLASISIVADNLDTEEANEKFMQSIRLFFAESKGFSPKDEKAVKVNSSFEFFLQIRNVMNALRIFIWIIGLATLCIGVVGISNIMLISVKERIKELGVRKAMGASSGEIIRLVLFESVVITVIFGYIGMLIGVGLTQLLKGVTDSVLGVNNTIFCNPTVNLSVVLIANAIMVVCGLIAGYIPAKKATTVKLVDALAGIS